ncbi:MAG: DUF3422 family protein [Cognatishimia sp.]
MPPIPDHPLRYRLANELHARPFPAFGAPATACFLAIKKETGAAGRNKDEDLQYLIRLLDRYGAPHPQPGATHYSGTIGRHQIKWEQHTEFVTYLVFSQDVSSRAYDPADFEVFPDDWLAETSGVRISSILIRVMARPDAETMSKHLKDWFVAESLASSEVLDASAVIAGDFRIDPAGHLRFAVFPSEGTGEQRIGRIVQRLCEIETYKSMSMLGFSRARDMAPHMGALEAELTSVMGDMSGDVPAENTLDALLTISSEIEALVARASFRFGATRAYEAIVDQRINVLRETRYERRQTFREFMMRRYDPAMRTVASTEKRLAALSDRAIRAGDLLRTKVDVVRSAQNQSLLASMDRRADLALRLQETVEGLSVVAIGYYAVSLAAYLFYPLSGPLGISKGTLTAGLVIPVLLVVWAMIRRIKARMH